MKKVIVISFVTILMVSAAWAQGGPGPQGNCDRMGMMGMGHKGKMGGGFSDCRMGGSGKGHMGGCHPGCRMGGPGMGHDGMPGIKMILRFADEIDLTDNQQKQLEQMMVDHQLARVELKAEVEKARIELRALKRDLNAPEGEVMRAIDAVSLARAEMAKQQYRHRKDVLAVLTDAQRDKLKSLRDEWREKRCEKRPEMGNKSFRGRRFGR